MHNYKRLVACDLNETRSFTWFVDNMSKWVNYARAFGVKGEKERENAESAAKRCRGKNESFGSLLMYAAEQPAPERPESKEGKAWIVEEKRGHKRRQRARAIEMLVQRCWTVGLESEWSIGWLVGPFSFFSLGAHRSPNTKEEYRGVTSIFACVWIYVCTGGSVRGACWV